MDITKTLDNKLIFSLYSFLRVIIFIRTTFVRNFSLTLAEKLELTAHQSDILEINQKPRKNFLERIVNVLKN